MRLLLIAAAVALASVAVHVDATASSKWHSSLLNARRAQAGSVSPSPSPSIGATSAATPSVTPSPSGTNSGAATASGTASRTPTPSITRSAAMTGTGTASWTASMTRTATPSSTSTFSSGATPATTRTALATRSLTASTTPLPSVSGGATPSASPLPPAVVQIVQTIAGVQAETVLNNPTVGAALRNAVKDFVSTTADTGPLTVLITALVDLATGRRITVDANSPLNTGSRRLSEMLSGPLDVASANVASEVAVVAEARDLQSTGFRVEYAVIVQATNVVDTGSNTNGETARTIQQSVANSIAAAVTNPSNTAAFNAILAPAVAQVATAAGVPTGSVASQLRAEETVVVVQPNPRISATPTPGPSPSVIAGAVLGAILAVALVVGLFFITRRCTRKDTPAQQPVVEE